MIRVAFGGAARSGKDFAADYLLSKHGGHKLKFADPLHEACRPMVESFGLPYERDRELLQFVGMWARERQPGAFIAPTMRQVHQEPDYQWFLTDLRFEDEAEALLMNGFVLVEVTRPKDLPEPDATWRRHISERALSKYNGWHYVIENCGTAEHFFEALDLLYKMIASEEHRKINFNMTHIR